MKKILLILLLFSPFISYNQIKWLKKTQVTTNKIENKKSIQIKYVTKDVEIVDFNSCVLTDNMKVLFWKIDYLKDSLYSYMEYSGDTCYFGINESKIIKNKVKFINEFKIIAGYKCQKGLSPNKRYPSKDITIWVTTDTTFKDYIDDRYYDIRGVILENEDEICIRTITEIKFVTKKTVIEYLLASIKPCNNYSPVNLNTYFNTRIDEKQDEIWNPQK